MWAYIAFTVISTAAQYYMQEQQSKEQERIAEENEKMQLREAEAVKQANVLESEQFKERARAFLSEQRARAGGGGTGLLSVSTQEVTSASERGIAKDSEIIRIRGMAEYNRARNKADIFGREAGAIRRARTYQRAATILGGARSATGAYYSGGRGSSSSGENAYA